MSTVLYVQIAVEKVTAERRAELEKRVEETREEEQEKWGVVCLDHGGGGC